MKKNNCPARGPVSHQALFKGEKIQKVHPINNSLPSCNLSQVYEKMNCMLLMNKVAVPKLGLSLK